MNNTAWPLLSINSKSTNRHFEVKTSHQLYFKNEVIADKSIILQAIQTNGLVETLKDIKGYFQLLYIDPVFSKKIYLYNNDFPTNPIYFHVNESDKKFINSARIRDITQAREKHFHINWDFLKYNTTHTSEKYTFPTAIDKIKRLRKGVLLTIDFPTWAYSFKHIESPNQYFSALKFDSRQGYINQYRELVSQSIEQQLTSDTKNALVTLSGGFDSSIIYLLAAKQTRVDAISICTETSLNNQEIDRAQELVHKHGGTHTVLPINFNQAPNYQAWIDLVLSTENLECGFESYLKSQLIECSKDRFNNHHFLFSGTGSDQFNGGTTSFDYAPPMKTNASWEEFMVNKINAKWEGYQKKEFTNFFQFTYHFLQNPVKEQSFPFTMEEEWKNYLNINAHFLEKKPVLLESKIFSRNKLVGKFPFLNQQIIDFLSKIPLDRYSELFYKKEILRAAFRDLLPKSFIGKPKFSPLSKGKEKIFKYMSGLVYGNDRSLIKLAYDASPALQQSLDIDKLTLFLDQTEDISFYPSFTHILGLVNLGLLDAYLLQGEHHLTVKENSSRHYFYYNNNDNRFNRKEVRDAVIRKNHHK